MENFIHERNILRFSARVETEENPNTRSLLGKLLVEEENKFALTAERLDKTEQQIAECKGRISRQHDIIGKLKNDGHDTRLAERSLENLIELHDLFVSHRVVLVDGLDRRAL